MKRFICLVGAIVWLCSANVPHAHAFKIWLPDMAKSKKTGIGPTIVLEVDGKLSEWQPGETVRAVFTVTQAGSGAIGVGHMQCVPMQQVVPLPPVLVHAVGPNKFQPGPAVCTYVAEIRIQGVLIQTWTRTGPITIAP